MKLSILRLGFVMGLLCLVGCAGPSLRSEDPLMRQEAMNQIQDQKALFLVAMNIEVITSDIRVWFVKANYREDVRLMAVNRLTDVQHLLRCATWPDGEVYEDPAADSGVFEYCGGKYYYFYRSDCKLSMREKVAPGDAVRAVAKKKLLQPEIFAKMPALYPEHEESAYTLPPSMRPYLFPYRELGDGNSFCDYYGNVRENNPFNNLIAELLAQHEEKDASAVVMKSLHWLHKLAPKACAEYVTTKLETASSEDAEKMYDKLYKGINDNYVKSMPDEIEIYALPLFRHIENPSVEMLQSVLALSSPEDAEEVLANIKREETLVELYLSDEFPQTLPEAKCDAIDGPYGSEIVDVKPDVAKRLLARITDQESLVKLATASKRFAIRLAAIERLEDVELLKKIASGEIESCPTDVSLGIKPRFGQAFQWIDQTTEASKVRLQKCAIASLSDAKALDAIRKASESSEIKGAITTRLKELGHSDVGAICAGTEIRADLFSMLAGIEKADELTTIADTAKLKAIRLLAACRLPKDKAQAVIAREAKNSEAEVVKGKFNIGGFALDMDIQDVYALLLRDHADVKPNLYLDGEVLCIGGSDGRDIAWANASSRKVHWLTLPPPVVQRLLKFESGSFDDLEEAVGRAMGVYFGHDILSKGSVSQEIGTIDTVGGETLRFFKTEIEEGEDFSRSVRKAFNQHSAASDPLGGGFGLALANAFEDAEQAEENQRNAGDPNFASRGAVQLQRTTRAKRGTLNSSGSLRREKKFPSLDTKAIEAEMEKVTRAIEAEMEEINEEIDAELEELREESDEMARKFMEEFEREAREFMVNP